jgi:UDP-N-acetylglucosamine 2-epimerase (non-hydrolysing)
VVPTMLPVALEKSDILARLGLAPENYFVATVHRAGAVDKKEVFARLLEGLGKVASQYNLPVIYPMHPHAKKNLEIFGLSVPGGVRIIEPADYINFLALSAKAKLILSDSGGIQEEAAMLHVPLVTLRDNTERQETVALGSNIVVGFEPEKILVAVDTMLARPKNWQHPYGQNVAQQIINIFKTELL